jgi:TatD DNase family protein
MHYIDIHTHSLYNDPETTLVLNVFPEELEKAGQTSYLSVGLHPWHVHPSTWETHVEVVRNAAHLRHVLAVGETGLDKVINVDYVLQHKAFAAQIEIAETNEKPMIIHCVRSYSEVLSYRKRSDQLLPWIFHWFNADIQIAGELLRKNCYLSFGHMLFQEQSKACRVFKDVSLDHVFFETDNAGHSIHEIYSKAATIRNMEVAGLQSQIMNNFERCFHL